MWQDNKGFQTFYKENNSLAVVKLTLYSVFYRYSTHINVQSTKGIKQTC